ncbi:nucleoside-diphosphate kinase [Vibrio breoganii]
MKKSLTLCLIKPDVVRQGLHGQVITDLESLGFTIILTEQFHFTPLLVDVFYAEHANKTWFHELKDYMTSGDSVALLLEREDSVQSLRDALEGNDQPSLREKYGTSANENGLHGSDSPSAVIREKAIIFSDGGFYE